MKKSELRQLIREIIKESINEASSPAENELRRLGINYELSDKPHKTFSKIFIPMGKKDDFYEKFNDVVYRYGLGGVDIEYVVDMQNKANLASLNENEGTYRVYMNSDPDEPERIDYEIYFGDGTKAEMIKQAKKMAYSNDPTNQYGDPILVKVTHEDDIDDVAFTNVPVNEVADPSALELVGALSTIIGGSLGIKFGMDLLTKIVDKLLKKLNPREAIKLFKDNAPALKAAAQEGKRAFVKKLMSLIINPTTTTSDYLDRIPKDPPFTIKRNEGTCGYDTDARTGKRFKTPGGL